jgi:outer membrane protein TolC
VGPDGRKLVGNILGWSQKKAPLAHLTDLAVMRNGQVVVAYAPDVFGGTRREVESLGGATAEFQRFQLEAAYLTLTSNVVAAAVQEASLRGQIAATEEIIKIETQALDILGK